MGSQRGILLVDLMFYVSLLAIVLALAAVVFNQFLSRTAQLRRNISDLERVISAGERWRADVRGATGGLIVRENEAVIPQEKGNVVYKFGKVVRRRGAGSEAEWVALAGVKASRMTEERRATAIGWKWEVELESRRKDAKMRPLFTFFAVPNEN